MPGYDGTGPRGMGSRTGGGFGFCPPAQGVQPVYGMRGLGRGGLPRGGGRGFGFGGGRGFGRRRFGPAYGYGGPYFSQYGAAPVTEPPPVQELQWLREEAEAMRQALGEIEQRIGELGKTQQDQ